MPAGPFSLALPSLPSFSPWQQQAPIILLDPSELPPEEPAVDLVALYYPEYASGENVNFSELFAPKYTRVAKPVKKPTRARLRDHGFRLAKDHQEVFRSRSTAGRTHRSEFYGIYQRRRPLEEMIEVGEFNFPSHYRPLASEIFSQHQLPSSFFPIVLDTWENKIVWETPEQLEGRMGVAQKESDGREEAPKPNLIRNRILDEDDWIDSIVWDDEDQLVPPPFIVEDPTILNDLNAAARDEAEPALQQLAIAAPPAPTQMVNGKLVELDPFNLSNDHFYENLQKKDHVRQTHGSAVLQHSLPAIMLIIPYFKTQLSIRERRSFHRPAARFMAKEEVVFAKVKSFKKKKVKPLGMDPKDLSEDLKNLSLRDSGNYVLLEYSEEYPPIMSNFGMGSQILNYYRKLNEKDQTTPPNEIGFHHPLDKVDTSPFMNFGDIEPGQTIQAITNNLTRAPLFKHEPPESDFLIVRYRAEPYTVKKKTKYYLREIPFVFVVGQTYPLQEVPKPHSRKVTNCLKGRLQVLSYRMMRANPQQRMWYPKLIKYFVGQSEWQLKQRLKEFAQFWKKGDNTGWWKLKDGKSIPPEDEIRKIITPETVCLFESAMVGEQRLRDIGYSNLSFKENENEDDETADIEVQLAPWTTTKNFIMATQANPNSKSKVYQKFSIMEQQVVYREEIKRIWNLQLRSLGNPIPPDGGDDDAALRDEEMETIQQQKRQLEISEENERKSVFGYAGPSSPTPSSPPFINDNSKDQFSDVEDDQASMNGSITSSRATQQKSKRLVIKRLMRGEDDTLEWRTEIVSDVKVINAYIRQRKLIESTVAENGATEDDAKKQRRKKTEDQIIKLKETSNKKGKGKKPKKEDTIQEQPAPEQPQTFKLKIPLASIAASSSSVGAAPVPPPKRRKSEQADYLIPAAAKSYGKRRQKPDVELSEILSGAVAELIELPEAYVFTVPVSASIFKDYYEIVKRPMTFEQIKQSCRNYQYKTADEFLADVQQVASNCTLYNGPAHPLTALANNLVQRARNHLQAHREDISRFEREIVEQANAAIVRAEKKKKLGTASASSSNGGTGSTTPAANEEDGRDGGAAGGTGGDTMMF
ncbi:hypothetical protein HK101_003757 [Irineochytrium annulatum]|nr:hypothetical protein HK101_003757 [Irineochytrium annulatum]